MERSVSFIQFERSTASLAKAILDLSEAPVVGVVGRNGIDWGTVLVAAIRAGGIVVPIDKELPFSEIHTILHFSGVNILFVDQSLREDIFSCFDEKGTMPQLVSMNIEEETQGRPDIVSMIKSGTASKAKLPSRADNRAPALISYTSGTMGRAKGVMLSQRNLLSDLRQMLQAVALSHDEVFLSILPMHHMYECVCGFLCPLSHGCTVVSCSSLKNITDDMKKHGITIMLGVPLLWESIYRRIMAAIRGKRGGRLKLRAGLAVSSMLETLGRSGARKKVFSQIHDKLGGTLRFLVSGGAGIDPEVVEGFEKLGFMFLQGYGLTECSPILAVNRDTANKPGSVGPPLPKVEVRILKPDPEGVGEIEARGPNVMLGYHENPEETSLVLSSDGWFRTGDFGYLDENGFLFVTGRKKNIIVAKNGKNVYPEELEQLLARSELFLETMVFGRASDQKGEEIWAIIVPDMDLFISREESEGEKISEKQIRSRVRSELKRINSSQPVYRRITRFILRSSELPKTTTRKVKRQDALREAGLEPEATFAV